MICSNCKKKITEGEYYCLYCGTATNRFNITSTIGLKKIKYSLITLLISIIILCCLFLFINSFPKSDPVDFIKTGVIDIYDTKNLGTAFERYFTNPNWISFETEEGEIIVEFTGELPSSDALSTHLIQFTIYPNEDNFEITYYELNQQSQTYEQLITLLDSIYTN